MAIAVVLCVTASVIVFLALVSLYIFFAAFAAQKRLTIEEEKQKRIELVGDRADMLLCGHKWFDDTPCTVLEMKSFDNLMLKGFFFRNKDRKGVVMLFHGYRSGPVADFAACFDFYYNELGMSVFIPFQRAHGQSEGKYIGFGVLECQDCADWAYLISGKFGADVPIFLDGISMGGTSVLMSTTLGLPPSVKGIISDCGFTSPAEIVTHVARTKMHLPKFPLYYLLDMWCRIFAHFSLSGASTIDAMKRNHIPVLFIHGDADTFVPPVMTLKNYKACRAPKKLVMVKNAIHGSSFIVNTPLCQREIKHFIEHFAPSGA